MSELRSFRFSRLAGAMVVVASLNSHAAELGEPVVRSHIGHNLVADIELTGLADGAAPVQVRLASPDVYRGANISMPPVLSALHLSVMRRDGRQFLHVISTRPVNAEHVNLFLELNDGVRRHVRAATLWLTPDPQPPAPPALPPPLVAAPVPKAAPVALVPRPPEPLPPRWRAAAVAAPAAACPKIDAEQLRTCAALDYKNGMLQARIVELEEKVKALGQAIEGRADIVPAAPAIGKPMFVKPKKPVARFPWLLVAAGIAGAAAVAGLLLFMRRKKAQLKGAPPPEPKQGLLAKLKARLQRKRQAPVEPVEPTAGS